MTNELLSSLSILHVHIKDKDFNVDKVTLSFRTKMEAPRLVLETFRYQLKEERFKSFSLISRSILNQPVNCRNMY